MKDQNIITTLFASPHPEMAERISLGRIIFSVTALLAGISVFAVVFRAGDTSLTVNMTLTMVGTVLMLLGGFYLFRKSGEIVYLPTGSIIRAYSIFFDLKYAEKLTEMIKDGRLDCESGVRSSIRGNIRMDIILSQDKNFAAVQLFRFVPYTYIPVTSARCLTGREAAGVEAFLAATLEPYKKAGYNTVFR